MKKLSFFNHAICLSMFLLVAFTACQKEEQTNQVDFQLQTPIATTHEAKVMQQTTNVIVSMLNENPTLFNDINEAIKSDAIEYMEDRILFADLFKNPQFVKSNVSQLNPVSFASEFRKHASINIQYAPAETRATTLDADALMQYLIDNNISVYCPFPLEDYEDDNRIPAIAANIGEEYEELPGVQFHADGTYDSVMVSQAYADLHPVWLINREEDYIFEDFNKRSKVYSERQNLPVIVPPIYQDPSKIPHYEVRFNSIFVTDYFGTLAGADLKIYLCKSTTEPYVGTDGNYINSFNFQQLYVIPRKNVRYAQDGLASGWLYIGYIFDDDWKTSEDIHYFAAYEKDSDYRKTTTAELGYNKNGINVGVTMTLEYYKYSDLICITDMSRAGMNNLVSSTNTTYYVNDQNVACFVAPDGYRLYSPSNTLFLSIAKTTYYVEE